MDTEKQDVTFTLDTDINLFGEVAMELGMSGKIFTGTFTLSGNVAGTIAFNYTLIKDFEDVTHFDFGPEDITTVVFGKPKLRFSSELDAAINADPEARAISQKDKKTLEIRKEIISMVAEKLYFVYMHNHKVAIRYLPASSFIID